jgi:hypothetical protein
MEKWDMVSSTVRWIIRYYNYWGNYIQGKKFGEDFLYIKYEQLVDNTLGMLKDFFTFYQIEMADRFLIEAIELNSYENTKKYISKDKAATTRRISTAVKPDFDDEVLSMIEKMKQKHLVHDFGYK